MLFFSIFLNISQGFTLPSPFTDIDSLLSSLNSFNLSTAIQLCLSLQTFVLHLPIPNYLYHSPPIEHEQKETVESSLTNRNTHHSIQCNDSQGIVGRLKSTPRYEMNVAQMPVYQPKRPGDGNNKI